MLITKNSDGGTVMSRVLIFFGKIVRGLTGIGAAPFWDVGLLTSWPPLQTTITGSEQEELLGGCFRGLRSMVRIRPFSGTTKEACFPLIAFRTILINVIPGSSVHGSDLGRGFTDQHFTPPDRDRGPQEFGPFLENADPFILAHVLPSQLVLIMGVGAIEQMLGFHIPIFENEGIKGGRDLSLELFLNVYRDAKGLGMSKCLLVQVLVAG